MGAVYSDSRNNKDKKVIPPMISAPRSRLQCPMTRRRAITQLYIVYYRAMFPVPGVLKMILVFYLNAI